VRVPSAPLDSWAYRAAVDLSQALAALHEDTAEAPGGDDERYVVFISHSIRDLWIAKQPASALERADERVRAFLDEEDLRAGGTR